MWIVMVVEGGYRVIMVVIRGPGVVVVDQRWRLSSAGDGPWWW